MVLSVEGEGKILGHAYDVEFQIGSGLFRKNVCYGGDRPDETFLSRLGLSCNGRSQTQRCTRDAIHARDPDFSEECGRFATAQTCQISALALLGGAILVRMCYGSGRTPLLSFALAVLVVMLSTVTMMVVKRTQMFRGEGDEEERGRFGCELVDAFELCEKYGAAAMAQGWGIFFAAAGALLDGGLLVVSMARMM